MSPVPAVRRQARLPLLLCCAALACGEKAPPKVAAAQLASVTGQVTVTRDGQAAQPAAPGPLYAGDLLQTGPASSALLRSNDGDELELGENARFQVELKLGKVRVALEAGVISIVGGEAAPGRQRLTVVTPYGETELAAGAKAKLSVEANGLGVDVAMGTITLVTEDGGAQTASAGQRLNLKMGSIELVDAAPKPAPQAAEAAPEPLDVKVAAEAGAPLLRKKGEARFTAAPRTPTALAEGTAFKAPGAARVRLEALGVSLRLTGAQGSFEKGDREGALRRYRVKLASGSGQAAFGPGETQVTLAGPKQEVELKASGEAAATWVLTPKGPRLELLAGELTVGSGAERRVVKAGEKVELSPNGMKVSARPAPALVLPADKKVSVQAQGLSEVGLSWPAGPAARVQVASDAAFEELVLTAKVSGPYVAVPAPRVGALYWRVLDESGAPLHKGQARFEADRDRGGGDTPRSEVAETGLKSTVFFQSALPTLTFTFPARDGAKKYRMRVFRAAKLDTPLVDKELSEPRGTVEAGTLGEGDYVWYAAPLDAGGNEQAGGRMNKLEIVYDNSLTTLQISRPRQGEAAGAGTQAAGVAPLRTKLFVNGKPVQTDDKGRFSVPVARAEHVVFRLVEPDGDERFWVRRLKSGR